MKKKLNLLAILLAVSLLTGCGGSSMESFDTAMPEEVETSAVEYGYTDVKEEAAAEETADSAAGTGISAEGDVSQTPQTTRKLIRTFDIHIETKEFDTVMSGVQSKVQELGGYIEQSSLDSGSAYYTSYNRYSNMTVRVPSDKVDQFIETVKETANVTNISQSAEDITLQYVDVESRKVALETERDRLLVLLEKAETVEDIITIESRLSEVRYQLEAYTSTLRTYDNQVDYSTVHLRISEVDRETKVEPKTFWEEVAEEFGDSVYGLTQGIRSFAIWFLGSSPYLILWAVFAAAVILFIRFVDKRRALKRTLKQAKPVVEEAPEDKEE